MVPIFLTTISG